MKYRFFILLITIFFCTCLTSCFSPSPAYYIKPLKSETKWYKGKEYIRLNKNEITVFLAFSRIKDNRIVFDLEINNFKKHDILVSPAEIFFYVLEDSLEIDGVKKYHAYDPEIMLLNIQTEISEEKANYLNYLSSQAILGFLEIVTDVATIGTPKSDEEINQRLERNLQQEVSMSSREASYYNRIYELENYYDNISCNSILKTTLKRFESIKGEIYLPIIHSAAYLKIIIPAGDEIFDAMFQQIKYNKNEKIN